MQKSRIKTLFIPAAFIAIVMIALYASSGNAAKTNGLNCIECHTSKDKLLADLKADPPPQKAKSAETSGEG